MVVQAVFHSCKLETSKKISNGLPLFIEFICRGRNVGNLLQLHIIGLNIYDWIMETSFQEEVNGQWLILDANSL
jgi:hypothetical protein